MNETKPDNNAHGGSNSDNIHHPPRPYWKRVHHDWRFWVAAIFIFVALAVYVLTDEFTLRPGLPLPPASNSVGK